MRVENFLSASLPSPARRMHMQIQPSLAGLSQKLNTPTHMCTHMRVCMRGTNHRPVDSLCTIRGPTTRRTRHGHGYGHGYKHRDAEPETEAEAH